MATIDDVKHWSLLRGIGCIVLSTNNGWTYTACGGWRSGDETTTERPKRVCSGCRAALPRLRPVPTPTDRSE